MKLVERLKFLWEYTHGRVALVIPSLSVNTLVQSSSLESKLDL